MLDPNKIDIEVGDKTGKNDSNICLIYTVVQRVAFK